MVCPAVVAVLAVIVGQVSGNKSAKTLRIFPVREKSNDTDTTTASYDYSYEGIVTGDGQVTGGITNNYGEPLQNLDYGSDYDSGNDAYDSGDLYGNGGAAPTSEIPPTDGNLASDIAEKIEDFFSRHASQPEKTFLKRVIKHVYKHLQGSDL